MSGLMSALLDPGVDALLGAAQGFGQAALPSRLPVPLGAALGMGAGGALQGVQTSERGQLAQQQIQAAQMQNQATASGLPATLASNALRTRMLQDPTLLNQMMGGQQAPSPSATAGGVPTPGSSTVPAPTASPSVTKNAFSSLPDDTTRTLAANAAMRAGLPQEAWPAWMATVHNESGWNINAPDNQDVNGSYDIGPGQINSRTARTLGYTPDQLRDPATNLLASAQYFGQQWQNGGGDPAKALAGYNTGSVGGSAPDYVAKGMTRLGGWGYAGAGSGAAPSAPGAGGTPGGAGDGASAAMTPDTARTMAQQYEQRANQLQQQQAQAKFWQGQGIPVMPPPGDPQALRTAAQQYRALTLAGPTKAAETAATAANQITIDRFGNMYRGTTYLGRGSEVKPVWNNATQQMEYGDVGGIGVGAVPPGGIGVGAVPPGGIGVGAVPPGGIGVGAVPPGGIGVGAVPPGGVGGGGGSVGQAVAPPPMQEHFMTERGKDLGEQFQQIDHDAAAAKESNYLFDNLRNDSQTWQMGQFAPIEADARAWLSATAHSFGIESPGLDTPLADYQAFNKSSGMLLRTAVHDTSSRAAVQEFKLIGDSLPTPTTSAQGFGQVADQWQALNDFRLAKQQFARQYLGHPQDFNVEFNGQVSPTAFLINRMSQNPQGESDMQAMFGRMAQTATGRLAVTKMQQEWRFARDAHLFDGLPATGSASGQSQPGSQ